MKRILFILLFFVLLSGCSNDEESAKETNASNSGIEEKHDKMLDSGVRLYLNQMTTKYANAYTVSFTDEDKMKYLNEAITDINLAVQEIEDTYEEGTPPTEELLELADLLLQTIENEMLGDVDSAYESAYEAGVIIGDLSREYLDGELPIGIKLMTEKESAFD